MVSSVKPMPRPASFCDLCVPCYDLAEVGIPSGPAAEARALCVKKGGVEEGTCDACGIVRPTIMATQGMVERARKLT